MTEKSKWIPHGPVGAQRFIRVEHSETGQVGYRSLSWEGGRPTAYGSVYSGPNCMGEDMCRECGIPVDQADTILCGVNGIGALVE